MGRGESQAPDLGMISCERGGRSSSSGRFRWGTAGDFGEKLPNPGGLHTASGWPAAASVTDRRGFRDSTLAARLSDLFFFLIAE